MESECETDSLDDENQESSESSGEREGERSVDGEEVELSHSRPQSVHIQIAEEDVVIGSDYRGSPLEEVASNEAHQMEETAPSTSADNEAAPEVIDPSAVCPSPTSSGEQPLQEEEGGNDNEVIESGLPPGESEVEMVTTEDAVINSMEKEATVDDDELSEAAKTRARKKERAKPPPWEMTYDPFTPISIEQVC